MQLADLDRLKHEVRIDEQLARRGISPVQKYGNRLTYHCPIPGHDDRNASCSVYLDENRFHCFGCGSSGSVVDMVAVLEGRDPKDVIRDWLNRGDRIPTPAKEHATLQQFQREESTGSRATRPCTVAALAERCRLPIEHLRSFGLSDVNYGGSPAVKIPYVDTEGNEAAVQFRLALEKTEESKRFAWRKGSRPTLLGWPLLAEAAKLGYVVIPEGASDFLTLRFHGFATIALPASTGWKEEYAAAFDEVERIYVVIEPDQGGRTVRDSFRASSLSDRVNLIYMSEECPDPSELHKQDPNGFKARFEKLIEESIPLTVEVRQEASARADRAWQQCLELAPSPRILDRFVTSLHRRGVAGEDRLAEILFLALVSRHLDRPVSVAVKGPSSGGKSYLIEQVLSYFPPSAYFSLSGMSEHALAYMEEPLAHRHLVVYEAAGMEGELATYLIRSLLSEGVVRYATVVKTGDVPRQKVLELEGPTGLIVTTTRASLHPENETRLLSLTVTDTPEQTRSVFRAIADESERSQDQTELEPWIALQTWLDLAGQHKVAVPFALDLAELIPPVAVRLRRDVSTVLNLVRAHALLHQARRERDQTGRVVATLDDYAVVRDLVSDLLSSEVGLAVSHETREAVQAVRELNNQTGKPISNRQVAEHLHLDAS
ncbi:MAG TPA: CHC2 zinc finger domain-containing protein, partial [Chloroflexota bacterium]|nr:CHC2 zinc finger domain-containing protein [Chloroflexota bacterium]